MEIKSLNIYNHYEHYSKFGRSELNYNVSLKERLRPEKSYPIKIEPIYINTMQINQWDSFIYREIIL